MISMGCFYLNDVVNMVEQLKIGLIRGTTQQTYTTYASYAVLQLTKQEFKCFFVLFTTCPRK